MILTALIFFIFYCYNKKRNRTQAKAFTRSRKICIGTGMQEQKNSFDSQILEWVLFWRKFWRIAKLYCIASKVCLLLQKVDLIFFLFFGISRVSNNVLEMEVVRNIASVKNGKKFCPIFFVPFYQLWDLVNWWLAVVGSAVVYCGG